MGKRKSKKKAAKNDPSLGMLFISVAAILVLGFAAGPMITFFKRSSSDVKTSRQTRTKANPVNKGKYKRIKAAQNWIQCAQMVLKKSKKEKQLGHLLAFARKAPIAKPLSARQYETVHSPKNAHMKFRIVPIIYADSKIPFFRLSFFGGDRQITQGGYLSNYNILVLNTAQPHSCTSMGISLLHETSHAYYAPTKRLGNKEYYEHSMRDEIRVRHQDHMLLKALGGKAYTRILGAETEKFMRTLKKTGGFKFSKTIPDEISSLYGDQSTGVSENKQRFMKIWTYAAFTALDKHFGKSNSYKYKKAILKLQGYKPH